MCTDCPKLYPLNPAPAAPSASPAAGKKKRAKAVPVTTEQILRERAESRRRSREAAKLAGTLKEDGIRIRGRWTSTGKLREYPSFCLTNYYTATRRQETQGVGSNYDGSYGVDSQDIMNIPYIGFGSFMFFPDQQYYGPTDPYLDSFTNILNSGIDWILKQAQSAAAYVSCISVWDVSLTMKFTKCWKTFGAHRLRFGDAIKCSRLCTLQHDHSTIRF